MSASRFAVRPRRVKSFKNINLDRRGEPNSTSNTHKGTRVVQWRVLTITGTYGRRGRGEEEARKLSFPVTFPLRLKGLTPGSQTKFNIAKRHPDL